MPESLTVREIEVYRRLIKGQNTKQIADELFLSPLTIRSRKDIIFQKMEVHSVQELLAKHIKKLEQKIEMLATANQMKAL